MALFWILNIFMFISQSLNIYCQKSINPPPVVQGSYRAIGEIVELLPPLVVDEVEIEVEAQYGEKQQKSSNTPESDYTIQVAFEENYDIEKNKAVYTLSEPTTNGTWVEDFRTGQVLKYENSSNCKILLPDEYNKDDLFPSLVEYGNQSRMWYTVKRFISLPEVYLQGNSTNTTFRNIPANMWIYEIKSKEDGNETIRTIYAYWSDNSWKSTSEKDSVPLGFVITTMIEGPEVNYMNSQTVSIFAFVHDAVNEAAFLAREGIYCEGVFKNEIKLPTYPNVKAISIHSEIALDEYLQVKTVDTWYDMKNKLLRIDFDRFKNQEPLYLREGRRISTEITSQELGATFEIEIFQGELSCEVTPLDSYEFEPQDIINPKLKAQYWDVHHIFGINTTNYNYLGKMYKRNMPCHLFQGRRTDWPEENAPVISQWEWCIASNLTQLDDPVTFRDGELPLVSLQIRIIESNMTEMPPGFVLMHHFYDVLQEDPDTMYGTTFDVSRCFNDSQIRKLQFTVDVSLDENNIKMYENATSDTEFLRLWREKIYDSSELSIRSLRITRLRSTIYNRILYVRFTLLGVHPSLPNSEKLKSLEDAEKALRSVIDKGDLSIKYSSEDWKDTKKVDLKAKPGSLVLQIDPTKIDHGTTTPPSQTSTVPTRTTTEQNIDKDTKAGVGSGHSPGTVIGVSIAMLVVGISFGAAGTFYKYRGLPQFLRR